MLFKAYAECRGALLHLLSAFGLDHFNLSNFSWSDGKELELINLSTKFSRKFYIFCKLYRFRVQKKEFTEAKRPSLEKTGYILVHNLLTRWAPGTRFNHNT